MASFGKMKFVRPIGLVLIVVVQLFLYSSCKPKSGAKSEVKAIVESTSKSGQYRSISMIGIRVASSNIERNTTHIMARKSAVITLSVVQCSAGSIDASAESVNAIGAYSILDHAFSDPTAEVWVTNSRGYLSKIIGCRRLDVGQGLSFGEVIDVLDQSSDSRRPIDPVVQMTYLAIRGPYQVKDPDSISPLILRIQQMASMEGYLLKSTKEFHKTLLELDSSMNPCKAPSGQIGFFTCVETSNRQMQFAPGRPGMDFDDVIEILTKQQLGLAKRGFGLADARNGKFWDMWSVSTDKKAKSGFFRPFFGPGPQRKPEYDEKLVTNGIAPLGTEFTRTDGRGPSVVLAGAVVDGQFPGDPVSIEQLAKGGGANIFVPSEYRASHGFIDDTGNGSRDRALISSYDQEVAGWIAQNYVYDRSDKASFSSRAIQGRDMGFHQQDPFVAFVVPRNSQGDSVDPPLMLIGAATKEMRKNGTLIEIPATYSDEGEFVPDARALGKAVKVLGDEWDRGWMNPQSDQQIGLQTFIDQVESYGKGVTLPTLEQGQQLPPTSMDNAEDNSSSESNESNPVE